MWRWLGLVLALLLAAGACGKVKQAPTPESCSAPTMLCGERCVDIGSDAQNCGSCGSRCPAGDRCSGGACSGSGCPGGETNCSGQCVNLMTSKITCGSCSNACNEAEACVNGACVCPAGGQVCNGACADLGKSQEHCGGCNRGCAPDSVCTAGVCRTRCDPPLVWCDAHCTDPSSDTTACGACGIRCGPGEQCVAGKCSCPTNAGFTLCGADCADLRTDNRHCGSCANACAPTQTCQLGSCGACPAGFFYCPNGSGDPLATCISQARTPSEQCQCNNCLAQLDACQKDPRCATGWVCAKTYNCTTPCWGAFTQCGGGTGRFDPGGLPADTTQRLDQLFNCAQANQCGY